MAAVAVLSNGDHHLRSLPVKRRNRPNMKSNATDNSVSFYNTDVPDFGRFLISETFADVQLVCGDNRISAHRSRLGAVSPFLASIFAKDTSETSVVILPDIKYETMRVLVHFLYTGFIRASESEVHDLLEAGCLLGIDKTIDIEQIDYQRNNVTDEARKQRKRQAPSGGKNEIQKKKKKEKIHLTQTVVIVDKFQKGSKMLPQSCVQKAKTSPDDTNNVITLEDNSVQDASDIEEMEICSTPTITPQKTVQDNISGIATEVASISTSNLFSQSQTEATTASSASSAISGIRSSDELVEETDAACHDASKSFQSNTGKDDSVSSTAQISKNKDVLEQQHRQGEDKSLSSHGESTPPDTVQDNDGDIVSVTPLDSPGDRDCHSSASTCAPPSPTSSSVHGECEENIDAELQSGKDKVPIKDTTSIEADLVNTTNIQDVNNVGEPTDQIQISSIQSMSETANTTSEMCADATADSTLSTKQQKSFPTDTAASVESSNKPQESPSQKLGLAKTVQQAVAGLLMWKSSKQKQASKSEGQQANTAEEPVPSSTLSPNESASKSNEPRKIEKRITVLSPKAKISEHDKDIIARALSTQMQEEKDPLAEDPPQTRDN